MNNPDFVPPRLHYVLWVQRPDNTWNYVAGDPNYYRLRDIAENCYGPKAGTTANWPVCIVEYADPQTQAGLKTHFRSA